MKKILLTGGTSFIGRNMLPLLRQHYEIEAPSRNELNLTDKENVDSYLSNYKFDILLHLAAPHPGANPQDDKTKLFDDMMRAFLHLECHANEFEKILYTGSGAEYDKSRDIKMASEEDIGKTIPEDPYGFAKYIMNSIARKSANIYNMRVFGCYGPTDGETKFIRHAIDCCLENEPIIIRQNCLFDYLYVEDIADVIKWFIENTPKFHDYNIVTGEPASLLEIAKIVAAKMNSSMDIKIMTGGWNNGYTASNERLMKEMAGFNFTAISEGIDKQIVWQRNSYEQSTNR
jgi:GDP-L-fucose synthase